MKKGFQKLLCLLLVGVMLLGINTTVSAGWPGTGGAPQVTQINFVKVGKLANGNRSVKIKVYGYGREYATLNGNYVKCVETTPFVAYGTTVDGFYYTYDCGNLPPGKYTFQSRHTSTNFPYRQLSFSCGVTFVD